MVGYNTQEQPLQRWEYTVAGATSGFITRGLSQPLDVLKIRFQLQLEPIRQDNSSSKYRGMYHCLKTVVREESMRSLWKGHVPAQVLSIVYTSVQFSCFEWLTKASSQYLPSLSAAGAPGWQAHLLQPLQHSACGSLAAMAAVVASQPADVLRTRLTGQGEPKVYRSISHAIMTMISHEGPRCFYKGLTANMALCMPQAAIQFGLFNVFVRASKSVLQDTSAAACGGQSLACGAASGVCAKLVVYPFDLAKKRLQVVGFEEARRPFGATGYYTGLTNCLLTMVRCEGVRGIYKGTLWSLLKAGVTTGLYFVVYDASCHALRTARYGGTPS